MRPSSAVTFCSVLVLEKQDGRTKAIDVKRLKWQVEENAMLKSMDTFLPLAKEILGDLFAKKVCALPLKTDRVKRLWGSRKYP